MKKVLTLFLALMMIVGCMTILPIGAADETVEVWNGSESTAPEGSGTKDDPYIIDSAADLAWMSANPNSGNQKFATLGYNHEVWYANYSVHDGSSSSGQKRIINMNSFLEMPYIYVKQVCDIDMGGHTMTSINSYWSCYGNNTTDVKGQFFYGEYDGQGYTIKNGGFKSWSTNWRWNTGMFGYVWGATIKNINFENMTATGATQSGNKGLLVGTVITPSNFTRNGDNWNSNATNISETAVRICNELPKTVIENIYVSGTCSVTQQSAGKNVNRAVGGIVGEAGYAEIRNCVSQATVNCDHGATFVGGVVGLLTAQVQVDNCVFLGDITFPSGSKNNNVETHVGGIVGSWRGMYSGAQLNQGYGAKYAYGYCSITNCVNFGSFSAPGTITGTLCLGNIVGASWNLPWNGTSEFVLKNNVAVSHDMDQSKAARAATIWGCIYADQAAAAYNATESANYRAVLMEDCRAIFALSKAPNTYPVVEYIYGYKNHNDNKALLVGNSHIYANGHLLVDPFVLETVEWVSEKVFHAKGTEADPYIVDDVYDLIWMQRVGGRNSYAGEFVFYEMFDNKYFVQTADIDLMDKTLRSIGYYYNESANWGGSLGWHLHPVTGEPTAPTKYENAVNKKCIAFSGHYDGQGYFIKNGSIATGHEANNLYWGTGLFGVIYGGSVKNVTVDNITINNTNNTNAGLIAGIATADMYSFDLTNYTLTQSEDGSKWVGAGAVVSAPRQYYGLNVIENCTVTNSTILDARDGSSKYIGGIVGIAMGTTVRNCYTDAVLSSTKGDTNMGGIVGVLGNSTKVEGCIYDGQISMVNDADANNETRIGGIVGFIWPWTTYNAASGTNVLVKDCINYGDVTLTGTSIVATRSMGGIVGGTMSLANTASGTKLVNCYNVGDIVMADGLVLTAGRLGLCTLVGCAYITNGHNGDALEIVNCTGLALTAQCDFTNANWYSTLLDGAVSVSTGNKTVDGEAGAVGKNDEGVAYVATSEDDVAALNAAAKAVLSQYKDTKGIKNYGVQSKVEEGKLSLRFINMLAYDLPVESISSISYSFVIDGDKDYESKTFTANKVYSAIGSADGSKIVAPEGYYYMFAVEVANGMTAEGSYTVTLNLSYELADGGKVTQLPVTLTVVEGVVSYN